MRIIGGTATAVLGAWLTVRSLRRVREEFGEVSGLPALGQFAPLEIGDDRAAEIIEQFAPALDAAVRGRDVEQSGFGL
jgi:hypothetical protein